MIIILLNSTDDIYQQGEGSNNMKSFLETQNVCIFWMALLYDKTVCVGNLDTFLIIQTWRIC
jgi:hypothetical protein